MLCVNILITFGDTTSLSDRLLILSAHALIVSARPLIVFENTIRLSVSSLIASAHVLIVFGDPISLSARSLIVFSNAIRIFARNYIVRRISSRNIWKKVQKLHFEHKALVSKPLLG